MYSKSNNNTAGNLRLFGNVRVMIISGLFVALSIVLGKFLQIPIGDSIRISFENLPLMMAGIFFGPFVGGAVGLGADLVGCLLKGYAINPIITLGAVSIGFLSGLVYMMTAKKKSASIPAVFMSVFSAHIVGSMLIKTIGLYIYYYTPMEVLFWRIPTYIAITVLETVIISLLLRNRAFSNQLDKVCNNGRL
ncbi:MAG: folate family ECF transporter S component [Ruminococcus flavefaciens]|nr:folate family ECF transporter S component [Ruminococcus flavefaciens]MCM1228977.1 folate family ECF transporter S component [Ruminococcus flavefaciens]